MKKRGVFLLALLAGVIGYGAWCADPINPDKEKLVMETLLAVMDQVHFNPQNLNDDFSKKAFKKYLNDLDGAKWFFTQEEVDQLKQYELKIDDEANAGTLEFFSLSVDLLDKAIVRSERIYNEYIDYDFDFDKKEILELDSDKKPFPKDEAEQKEYWRKYLKYQIVSKLDEKMDAQTNLAKRDKKKTDKGDILELESSKNKEASAEKKTKAELIVESQEETKELYDGIFERINEMRRSDRFEAYLNAFANLYDPHTTYFSPKGKQDFDIRMGGKLEGIGARLGEEGDYTKIASIVPGGPAWQGKELEVDDIIYRITQKGEEGEDIKGMRIDDVVSRVRGKKGTVVILTVKKKDGSMQDVEIERDEIILDVAYARSAIMDVTEKVNNIGFIRLPSFYSSFDGGEGNSCAIDVAKEIEKLKKENVNGIILDLRYNGGGSLPDVIDMSGLFIEEGPVVQVKSRSRPAQVYNDEDESVLYDGPLIVMVNVHSASASEILAAALQDYKRAVIVGSESTFGKGTVQGFFDLDRALPGNSDLKPLGQVKLTFQKFYRVNGGSNQLKGVIPDIVLPDQFSYIKTGEKEEVNPLAWSEIDPVKHSQNVYRMPNLTQLAAKSKVRIQNSEVFTLIDEDAKRLKENQDDTVYPIDLAGFSQAIDDRKAESKKYTDILDKDIAGLNIRNMEIDLKEMASDSAKIGRNEDWLQQMQKDVYIEECLMIMKDMIQSGTTYVEGGK
ncbi:MAG: carboxy terminal-processing peptidase [Saprospiraceae bacterium]